MNRIKEKIDLTKIICANSWLFIRWLNQISPSKCEDYVIKSTLAAMSDNNQTKPSISIHQAQQIVDEWINTTGVRYFNELTNMAILTEEVGEVARIIARRYGEQSEKESDRDKDLGDELADVMWVVMCLANQTGVNLEEAFVRNMEKKSKRDATRHLNNPKLKS